MNVFHLFAHLLQLGERFLEHVKVRRLAPPRGADKHKSVPHNDHLVQLDHLPF